MAVTEGTARSTAIIGIIELVLALIAIICGGVAMSKMTSPAGVTIGIWALYVSTKSWLSVHKRQLLCFIQTVENVSRGSYTLSSKLKTKKDVHISKFRLSKETVH